MGLRTHYISRSFTQAHSARVQSREHIYRGLEILIFTQQPSISLYGIAAQLSRKARARGSSTQGKE
jgi:hypothetical protein